MANETQNEGTPTPEGEAQTAQPTGTPPQVDEVTTLRSRNAGLDAKVTSLSQTLAAETAARAAAEAKVQEYISGKAVEDGDTRALIQRLEAERNAAMQAAKAGLLGAKYPEAFGLLGEAISAMSEDTLAATEARLRGIPQESNTPPVPVAVNAGRTSAPATKSISDMSLAELKDYGRGAFRDLTWEAITQSD